MNEMQGLSGLRCWCMCVLPLLNSQNVCLQLPHILGGGLGSRVLGFNSQYSCIPLIIYVGEVLEYGNSSEGGENREIAVPCLVLLFVRRG